MSELLVIEKIIPGGGCELVTKGYSRDLLNLLLAQEKYTVRDAAYLLRPASEHDDLSQVPYAVKAVSPVILRR